ncbi:YdeI/OmpD-associated family protein [Actinomadura alba]|uniref:YdeI/OmpD-associated family protein n=1 Tax=Actinomadura alba TaxID=406431 RepID=UPI0031CE1637
MSTFLASTSADWRAWLARNHRSAKEVWLVIHHKDSRTPSVRYHEAIEHALCYGWIDSHARKHDADSSRLRFTPRSPRSTWSRVNRRRAAKMIELGLMTEHGQAQIELARANGTWQVLPDAENSAVPDDLRESLDRNEAARGNFQKFPPSSKRLILQWIATAKRPETRRRRIDRTVDLAAVNIRANHPGVRMGGAVGSAGAPR